MTDPQPPRSTHDLLSALADGELDLRESTDALVRIADDPQGARRIAFQQQLRRSVASAMDDEAMRCPEALRRQVEQLARNATEAPASTPAPVMASAAPSLTTSQAAPATPSPRPATQAPPGPVLARIGRWAPAAVAAVLLLAAVGIFFAARPAGPNAPTPAVLDVRDVRAYGQRHMACAGDPSQTLHNHQQFGQSLTELPGKLADYLDQPVGGQALDLSHIDYDYQLAGVCSLPGSGAVHIVYRHHDHPDRAMSLWIVPAQESITRQMQPGRLYVETADGLDHPVILWEDRGLLYYLVGDSLQDAQFAVQALRQPPA